MAQYRLTNVRIRGGAETIPHNVTITWSPAITALEAAHDISLPRCANLQCFARHLESRLPRLLAIDRVIAEELLGRVAAGFVGCLNARLIYVDNSPENNIHIMELFTESASATLTDGIPRDVLVREIMSTAINVS